jgi:hypothetical protein
MNIPGWFAQVTIASIGKDSGDFGHNRQRNFIEIPVRCDFADVFEVKANRIVRRGLPGSPRDLSLATRTIRAPISASFSAATSPMPEVPPVTTTVFPFVKTLPRHMALHRSVRVRPASDLALYMHRL